MAFTVNKNFGTMGNFRVALLEITADSTEAAIDTGLGNVVNFTYCPISMTTTTVPTFLPNVGTTGTAALGKIAMSTVVSGDYFYMVVYGN